MLKTVPSKIFKGFFSLVLIFIFYSTQANSPVSYVQNLGQWEDNILYKATLSGGYVFAEEGKITFLISEGNEIPHIEEHHSIEILNEVVLGSYSYQMEFLNSNSNAKVSGYNKLNTYHNYFTSNNPAKWKSNVPLYESITYHNIYDNIDLVLKTKDFLFEYDFVIHPDADVSQIRMKYNGIQNPIIMDGQLHLQTPMGKVIEMAPIVFQEINGQKVQVKTKFVLHANNEVGFEVIESFNKNEKLIIDPILVFSTYTGSLADNWGFTATFDNEGNHYAGGMVSGEGYPTTIGAYDTLYAGGESFTQTDIAISKFSPDGTQLVYSTYIGGSNNEIPHSLIATDNNELVIYGTTGSFDYPVNLNAYDASFNGGSETFTASNINYLSGSDIVITKLNVNGTNLIGSTFFGGTSSDGLNATGSGSLEYNYGDFARGDITIGDDGDIFVASSTFSDDVEVGAGSFQPLKSSQLDGLVARFNSDLTELKWATYVGGTGADAIYSIELLNDEVIIAGGTTSSDLPGMDGLNASYQGGHADGFILKLNNEGTASTAGTFIGTTEYDQTYFLDIDKFNNIYVYGQTLGDYPITDGVASTPNGAQFIHKLNNNLTTTDYSTVFGGPNPTGVAKRVNLSPTAFLVDNCTNVYAIGWGGNVNNGYNNQTGNTNNMLLTSDAFQTQTDGSDFYFIVFEDDASNIQYATYFGEVGGTGDHVDGGTSRFDKNGIVYHASCASCGQTNGFPTTDGVWSENNQGANCNMAAYKFRFDQSSINAVFEATPVSGCPPLEVEFSNFSNVEGDAYFWDFDDGTTSIEENPVHVFTEIGEYNVEFIIVDSTNCSFADTAYVLITVTDTAGGVQAAFDISDSLCQGTNITFLNLSENSTSYLWDFGDGNTSTLENPIHTYAFAGNYTVTLISDPGSNCGDTATLDVQVFDNEIELDVSYNQSDCSDTTGTLSFFGFNNVPNGIATYLWDFGDGTTSTEQDPSHSFEAGEYVVTLLITDSVGCSQFDSELVTVSRDTLSVDFVFTPSCDPLMDGIQFFAMTDSNRNIVEYQWDFGEGFITFGPENPVHFYSQEGNYTVTLTVTDDAGCTASVTYEVPVFTEILNANFTYEPLVCGENTINFINNSAPIDDIQGYLWDFGDGNTSTETSPSHTYVNVGFYTVSLTVFSNSGCQSSSTDFIFMPELDINLAIGPIPECNAVNNPIQFGITGTSSSNLTQFDWDFGDGTTALNTFSTTHTYADTGTYLVQYFTANAEGCTDTASQLITIAAALNVDILFNRDACSSDDLSVDFAIDAINPTDINTIDWNFGDGTLVSDDVSPTHTYTDSGTYMVIVTIETNAGCTGTDTLTLNISSLDINAQFITAANDCADKIIDFNNQSTSEEMLVEFYWDFGDGNSSDVENPTHEFADTGTFTVSLLVISESGCRDSITQDIFVEESVITAGFDLSIDCNPANLEVQFTDTSIASGVIVGWNWNFGDGESSTTQSPSHVYASEGNYDVELIIESDEGCIDTLLQSINVDIPDIRAGFTSDTLVCSGSTVNFTNNTIADVTIDNWEWTFGNGNSSNEENPSNVYLDEGTFIATLIASTSSGCADTVSIEIEVVEAEGVALVDSVFICVGDSIELPLSGNVGQSYNWQPNEFIDDVSLEQPTVFPPSNTFYSVTVEETLANGNVCSLNDGVWVIVNPLPFVEATADQTTIEEGGSITLNATTGFEGYTWSPNENLSDNTINNPTATIFESITYTVEVVDENGCVSSDSVSIEVIENENCQFETLYVPNAFSPNGDGQNDVLYVRIQGEIEQLDFRIYNRWGNLVFETNDLSFGWDGTYENRLQSTDVFGYFLEIECNGEVITKQGNITLVR